LNIEDENKIKLSEFVIREGGGGFRPKNFDVDKPNFNLSSGEFSRHIL
jgi:hypothetical protein